MKNHNLGLEVPYRHGSETRRYLPDFIVLVDDGHGDGDLLDLVVEIKGYRSEDAKEKKATMVELTEIYQIDVDFKAKVDSQFDAMIVRLAGASPAFSA